MHKPHKNPHVSFQRISQEGDAAKLFTVLILRSSDSNHFYFLFFIVIGIFQIFCDEDALILELESNDE